MDTKKHPSEQSADEAFSEELSFISEINKNLMNGLAISINTTFESHVRMFVREMSKKNSSIKYNERHTYKMNEFVEIMKKAKHPNYKKMDEDLLIKLRVYTDIRNCLVHSEGQVSENSIIRAFVLENQSLFVKHNRLWIISVNSLYIRKAISDLKVFFKRVAYTKGGKVIFY